jgi:hypothetical protein
MTAPFRSLALAALVTLAAGLLGGCGKATAEDLANGDDALAALRSPVRSARYDGAFWNREATEDTRLWHDAVDYCRTPGNSAAPNCQTVGLVLSTIELEKAAREAKRQLEVLLEQSKRFAPPRRAPAPPADGRN